MTTTIKGIAPAHPEGGYTLGEKKLHRKYVLAYIVKTTTTADGIMDVLATTGLPKVGFNTYAYEGEFDLAAVCKSKKAKRMGKRGLYWLVTCEFDNQSNSESEDNENEYNSPLDRPYELDWSSVVEEVALWQDFSDPPKAIVNSAGERFPEPVTGFVVFPVLTIKRWEASFAASTILAYSQHRNSAPWNGAAAGQVICEDIRATRVLEENALLWNVTYAFKYSPLAWYHKAKILDQGTYYLSSGDKKSFLTDDNVPFVGNLNGSGAEATSGSFAFREFERHPAANFGDLNLV